MSLNDELQVLATLRRTRKVIPKNLLENTVQLQDAHLGVILGAECLVLG